MDHVIITKKFSRLKMSGAAETFELRLDQAIQEKWSHSALLEMLLTDEIERRDYKQLTLRLSKSRLSPSKTMETFDLNFNSKLPVTLVRELSNCSFIERKQNIFILGPSGVGKSHLAQALGHQACRREYGVLFYDTLKLFDWISSGRGDGTHKKRLANVIKIPLLILDDFALQTLEESQQNDLYELISERYEKHSTIITSNRDFDEWPNVFSNRLLGTAALDRLVHRGIQIIIEGESYRLSEFKKACSKSQNK